jgi:predicted permease
MSNAGTVFNQVLILFFIMIIGFISKKRGIFNSSVNKKLSELLLKVTSPLLVISSFQVEFTQDILKNVLIVFVFAMSAHIFSILLGQVLFRHCDSESCKIMKFSAVFSNCGYMGFPLLASLFGNIGVLYGSVYIAAFNIFLWTNGVMTFSDTKKLDRQNIKKILLNPGIVSVVIGILLFVFSLKLPVPVASAVEMVGSMTSPLSMLIIGATIADCELKNLFKGWNVYYITAVRLILIPLIAFGVLKLAGMPDMLLKVCVLVVAMPIATTTAIFAELYDSDSIFASRAVVLSTLLSIITIPLFMLFI